MEKINLFKHSAFMMLVMAVANILNFLFQLMLVRWLEPADYGLVNALFAVFMILSIPGLSVQTVAAKVASECDAKDEMGEARYLSAKFIRRTMFAGFALFVLMTLFSRPMAAYIKTDNVFYIILLALIVFASLIFPFYVGVLRGFQKFAMMGGAIILNAFLRLLLAALGILAGWKVLGVLGAMFGAVMMALLLAYVASAKILSRDTVDMKKTPSKGVYEYLPSTAIAFFAFMVLTNVDIILVKHYFSAETAGNYSIASMAGRIVIYLPQAVALVMFPKISYLHSQNRDTFKVFTLSLFYTFCLTMVALVVIVFIPQVLDQLLAGGRVPNFHILTMLFGVSMTFFAILNVIIHYNLSVKETRFVPYLVGMTMLHTYSIAAFGRSIERVLIIMCVSGLLFILSHLLFILRKHFLLTRKVSA